MSTQHVIDGEEPLFDFEGFEPAAVLSADAVTSLEAHLNLADMSHIPHLSALDLSAYAATSTPTEVLGFLSSQDAVAGDFDYYYANAVEENVGYFKGKGKAASRPVDIASRDGVESQFDLFSFETGTSGSSRGTTHSKPSSSTSTTPQSLASFSFSPGATPGSIAESYTTDATSPGSCIATNFTGDGDVCEREGRVKGKNKEDAPSLPPLHFSATEFSSGETSWPDDDEGHVPSSASKRPSYGGLTASSIDFPSSLNAANALQQQQDQQEPTEISNAIPYSHHHRPPTRVRSFSSLSSLSSTKSIATRSMSKLKLSFGKRKSTSNLARKLLLRKDAERVRELEEEATVAVVPSRPGAAPFVSGDRRRQNASSSAPVTPTFTPKLEVKTLQALDRHHEPALQSDLCGDVFLQAGDAKGTVAFEKSNRNLFDEVLPRETKLKVFKALLHLHEAEGEKVINSNDWTLAKAVSRGNKHIGRERGFIELVRMSRVSKSWQQLVFDGQLWVSLDLAAFPKVPTHLLKSLAKYSGSFVRSVDFTGHTRLSGTNLYAVARSFRISNAPFGTHANGDNTQLTHINLTGCSAITTHALNDILSHSPHLTSVRLKGLTAVVNSTLNTLADHCPLLSSLNVGRCRNIDTEGLISFLTRHDRVLLLKELRLSGLKRVNDNALKVLGMYAPDLEVLDLSGASTLHNTSLDAFTSMPVSEVSDDVETVLLTSREAGRDPGDPTKYRRRVTKLRHLSLSYCPLLTDIACSHLAHAVPKLEFLELAGIGTELKDDGVVRLLATTPLIRKLDLEENCDITDEVLRVLTPVMDEGAPSQSATAAAAASIPQTGSLLEQLNLSYAIQLTNEAMSNLIRACTRLRTLEVDNTRISNAVVKEFVRLARKRELKNAELVAVDCRSVGESAVKDLSHLTRTRKGWRAWDARNLHFVDSRDGEALGVGQDECDASKVVLKTFYSWQMVDAVEAAREKRRKANKKAGHSGSTEEDYFSQRKGSSKWWSPGSRRFSGSLSPALSSSSGGDNCIIM